MRYNEIGARNERGGSGMKDALRFLGIFFVCIGTAKLCLWGLCRSKGER